MKPGNRSEVINILLILGCQFETSLKLEMTDLAESACGIDGQVVIARIENDPENDPIPGTCCEPVLHGGIITRQSFSANQKIASRRLPMTFKPLTLTLR